VPLALLEECLRDGVELALDLRQVRQHRLVCQRLEQFVGHLERLQNVDQVLRMKIRVNPITPLSIHASVHLSIHLSIYLSVELYLPIYLYPSISGYPLTRLWKGYKGLRVQG